jgi:hypothetical protein
LPVGIRLKDGRLVLVCKQCQRRYDPVALGRVRPCSHITNAKERNTVSADMLSLGASQKMEQFLRAMQMMSSLDGNAAFPFAIALELDRQE